MWLELDLDKNQWIISDINKIRNNSKMGIELNNMLRLSYNILTNVSDPFISYTVIDKNYDKIGEIVEDLKESVGVDFTKIDNSVAHCVGDIKKNFEYEVKNLRSVIESELKLLKKSNEVELNKLSASINNSNTSEIDEKINIISNKISENLNKYNKNLDETIFKLCGSLEQTNSIMNKLVSSSSRAGMIGEIGEKFIEDVITKNFKNIICDNISRINHSGDILLRVKDSGGDYNIMVECKKYSKSVPQKEVDKFYRDLNDSDNKFGIMISLDSKICGKRQFDIYVGDNADVKTKKYALFCSNIGNNEYPIIWSILIIQLIYESIDKIDPNIDNSTNIFHDLDKFLNDIDDFLKTYEKNNKNLTKVLNSSIKNYNNIMSQKDKFIKNHIDFIRKSNK